MKYTRTIKTQIQSSLHASDDIIVIYGARQVGKTSLCYEILSEYEENHLGKSRYFQCEDQIVQNAFESNNIDNILNLIGDYDLVVLDEAQSIVDIGWRLKLIADYNETADHKIKIIATGSSSFELANNVNEPLTGRAEQYWLFPLTLGEIRDQYSIAEMKYKINSILVYGLYPSIFDQSNQIINKEIQKIFSNYLYKDILHFENIKKSTLLTDLTRLLALQIGHEISLNSLAQKLNTSIATIERYLNLLEQTFIIFRLRTLNRNSSKEITRNFKIYFYDLGVRNYIINNFNSPNLRTDIGELWENFCVIERVKMNIYRNHSELPANQYFWRTYTQAEIDFIEEKNGYFHAMEFKYSSRKHPKLPIEFARSYPNNRYSIIHSDNFTDFLL
jgi:uncharacterized protein